MFLCSFYMTHVGCKLSNVSLKVLFKVFFNASFKRSAYLLFIWFEVLAHHTCGLMKLSVHDSLFCLLRNKHPSWHNDVRLVHWRQLANSLLILSVSPRLCCDVTERQSRINLRWWSITHMVGFNTWRMRTACVNTLGLYRKADFTHSLWCRKMALWF